MVFTKLSFQSTAAYMNEFPTVVFTPSVMKCFGMFSVTSQQAGPLHSTPSSLPEEVNRGSEPTFNSSAQEHNKLDIVQHPQDIPTFPKYPNLSYTTFCLKILKSLPLSEICKLARIKEEHLLSVCFSCCISS